MPTDSIVFIGGGNMASALIGGLLEAGLPASAIQVVEPDAAQRDKLAQQFGVDAQAAASPALVGSGRSSRRPLPRRRCLAHRTWVRRCS
jgi:pyrroline-5-carboxylate reductase